MMPQPEELLELRLSALAADISRVQQIAHDAKRRRRRIDNLTKLVGDFGPGTVRGRLDDVRDWVTRLADDTDEDDELWKILDNHGLANGLSTLPDLLKTIRHGLGEVGRELSRICGAMIKDDWEIEQLTTSLDTRCRELIGEVVDLRTRLRRGDQPRDVWDAYELMLKNGCHDLFADYVDFLAGLTLRDTALDDDVCAITDALLAEIPRQVKHLAIPARRPTLSTALNKLVKVGFPEWTIWNIPLVGHEIGIALACEQWGRQLIGQTANALPGRDVAVREVLFADAYAAYTVGPAYGCAVTLLRLQPNHDAAAADAPSDVERAAVIMAVLRQTAEGSPGFRDVIDRAEGYWREAVTHVAGAAGPPAGAGPFAAFANQICDALNAERIEKFGARQWGAVAKLTGVLQGEVTEGTRVDRDVDVRVLLNAAWAARLANPPEDILWATALTSQVRVLWPSVAERRSTSGGRRGR